MSSVIVNVYASSSHSWDIEYDSSLIKLIAPIVYVKDIAAGSIIEIDVGV